MRVGGISWGIGRGRFLRTILFGPGTGVVGFLKLLCLILILSLLFVPCFRFVCSWLGFRVLLLLLLFVSGF